MPLMGQSMPVTRPRSSRRVKVVKSDAIDE